jgi:hypothetical protein
MTDLISLATAAEWHFRIRVTRGQPVGHRRRAQRRLKDFVTDMLRRGA